MSPNTSYEHEYHNIHSYHSINSVALAMTNRMNRTTIPTTRPIPKLVPVQHKKKKQRYYKFQKLVSV